MDKRDECKRSADEASKQIYDDTKTRVSPVSWEQHGRNLLTSMRGPAFRRHDSYPGFRTELENRVGDAKGKGASGRPTRPKVRMHRSGAHCLVRAMKRGNARGAKGAGHPRQDGVNGQPEELLSWRKPGRASLGWHEPDEARVSCPDL
jgi:hypothetical protein